LTDGPIIQDGIQCLNTGQTKETLPSALSQTSTDMLSSWNACFVGMPPYPPPVPSRAYHAVERTDERASLVGRVFRRCITSQIMGHLCNRTPPQDDKMKGLLLLDPFSGVVITSRLMGRLSNGPPPQDDQTSRDMLS
jgi:hypothetical protein